MGDVIRWLRSHRLEIAVLVAGAITFAMFPENGGGVSDLPVSQFR